MCLGALLSKHRRPLQTKCLESCRSAAQPKSYAVIRNLSHIYRTMPAGTTRHAQHRTTHREQIPLTAYHLATYMLECSLMGSPPTPSSYGTGSNVLCTKRPLPQPHAEGQSKPFWLRSLSLSVLSYALYELPAVVPYNPCNTRLHNVNRCCFHLAIYK